MNILFISSQPYPNGMAASKRIRLFAEYLAENNNVEAFVCGNNNGNNQNKGEKAGVFWKFIKFTRFQYFLSFLKIYRLLRMYFIKGDKNIILLYDGINLTNILFAIISRIIGYTVFTDVVEDYNVTQEKESFWRRFLLLSNRVFEKYIFKFVNGVIVISENLMIKHQKGNVINIPISAENLKSKYTNDKFDIYTYLYSGSFGVKDGIKLLINAFNIFSKNKEVQLFLSGKITNEIKNLIRDNKKITYVGLIPEEEYYPFLNKANVLLMTRIDSNYANSGFPFKLGEYLASSNPVIATKVSDLGNFLSDKEDVIFAKPSNVESIVEALEFTYLHKSQVLKIGKRGKEVANEHFNPEKNGVLLEKFLKKTIINLK